MKSILFIALLALIICSPYGIERRQKIKERNEKIKKCVNENGSESLKNLINNYDGISMDDFVKKNDLTENDLEIYKDCRRKSNY